MNLKTKSQETYCILFALLTLGRNTTLSTPNKLFMII